MAKLKSKEVLVETDLGDLYISTNGNAIASAYWKPLCDEQVALESHPGKAQIQKFLEQLEEYLHGERKYFQMELQPMGTDFENKVWSELQKIPYGETRSYHDIAKAIGNPKAVRAVGRANGKNPIGIAIPCHRVVAKSGALSGYAGGVKVKERLLKLEQA